jgi:hypothetical protein
MFIEFARVFFGGMGQKKMVIPNINRYITGVCPLKLPYITHLVDTGKIGLGETNLFDWSTRRSQFEFSLPLLAAARGFVNPSPWLGTPFI